MSILSSAIGNKVITPSIKSMVSYLPGEIVGEGDKLFGELPSYNIKVYNGNIKLNGYNSWTIHKNVPFSFLNSTTQSVDLKEGDRILVGKLNNDENTMFILNGGNQTKISVAVGAGGIVGDGSINTEIYTGTFETGNSDTTIDSSGRPIWGTAPSAFDSSKIFVRGDADDLIPDGLGTKYYYMNWDSLSTYQPEKNPWDPNKPFCGQGSAQAQLRRLAADINGDAKIGGDGYWMIGNRFCVAMTYWYANISRDEQYKVVGSVCDVYLKDGSIIPVIVADVKSDGDPDWTIYGHRKGANIVEFVTNWKKGDGHDNPPDGAPVVKVVNGGNYLDNRNLAFVAKVPISSFNGSGKKIFLDPGHNYSGGDTGAQNGEWKEQNITFEIATRVKDLLVMNGFAVQMSRNSITDNLGSSTDESLAARVKASKKFKPALFVSIHCNSNSNRSAKGTEVYSHSNKPNDKSIADKMSKKISEILSTDNRGGKEGNFYVIRENNTPSVLVEVAFISNSSDLEVLKDYDKCAKAVYEAIIQVM